MRPLPIPDQYPVIIPTPRKNPFCQSPISHQVTNDPSCIAPTSLPSMLHSTTSTTSPIPNFPTSTISNISNMTPAPSRPTVTATFDSGASDHYICPSDENAMTNITKHNGPIVTMPDLTQAKSTKQAELPLPDNFQLQLKLVMLSLPFKVILYCQWEIFVMQIVMSFLEKITYMLCKIQKQSPIYLLKYQLFSMGKEINITDYGILLYHRIHIPFIIFLLLLPFLLAILPFIGEELLKSTLSWKLQ